MSTRSRSRSNETYETPFAAYYDRLTGHKDYEAEAAALARLIEEMCSDPEPRILDVGCGTGSHAAFLAGDGYDVTAIDLSSEMTKRARVKAPGANVVCGDIGELSESGFAVCVSLFNVVNHLESLESLTAFFVEIARRLVHGGALVVEAWNPVAAIAAPPETVVRTYEDGRERIERTVVPSEDFLHQRLSLEYRVEVLDAEGRRDPARSFAVTHELRLFTPLEIDFALRRAGFGEIQIRTALPDLDVAAADDRMLAFVCSRTGEPAGL